MVLKTSTALCRFLTQETEVKICHLNYLFSYGKCHLDDDHPLEFSFQSFLEIIHHSGKQMLINRDHVLSDGILQLIQITVTASQVTP